MSFMTDPFHDIIQELSDQNKILQAELTKLQIEKNVLKLDNEIIALEWFKKGMAVLTDDGNPDRETSLSNLCKMADSALIGQLKKEEQE